jgi:hypothetical protein
MGYTRNILIINGPNFFVLVWESLTGIIAARSDPPVVPSGPLGVSPEFPLCPPVLVVMSLCPPVLLVSLLIPPRVLRCPWCLLNPTVV